jgi:hypothetical protein
LKRRAWTLEKDGERSPGGGTLLTSLGDKLWRDHVLEWMDPRTAVRLGRTCGSMQDKVKGLMVLRGLRATGVYPALSAFPNARHLHLESPAWKGPEAAAGMPVSIVQALTCAGSEIESITADRGASQVGVRHGGHADGHADHVH